MDTENLIHAIERTLAATTEQHAMPEFVSQNPYYAELWRASIAGIPLPALSVVIEQLQALSEINHLENGWIRRGWSGGASINLHQVADWLVAQARTNGVRETVTAFEHFVASNKATAATILAVRGVTINRLLELTDAVKILPLTALPPSIGKAFLARLLSGPHVVGALPLPSDVAALMYIDEAFSPVVTGPVIPFVPFKGPSPQDLETSQRQDQTLTDVLRCLTLVGPCSPVAVGSWSQLIGPGVPMTTAGGYGYNHETAFMNPVTLGPFDAQEAQLLIKAFFQHQENIRQDLRVPLDRLNRAIRGTNIVDQAIDLGIALEAMLFHGSNDNKELSFRLSLRGAWFSGTDGPDRLDRYRLLKNLYDLRSRAVHNGHLKIKQEAHNRALLRRGFTLCADLLKKIIKDGAWPSNDGKWDELIFDALGP
jgi:hypothetical protein